MRYSHAGTDSRARAMQAIDGHENGHKKTYEEIEQIYKAIKNGQMSLEDFGKVFEK